MLKRTTTGIICNRRPTEGAPAHDSSDTSSSGTPEGSNTPRYSLLAQAKRDAAKKGLYSRFFRGPTLGPDTALEKGVKERVRESMRIQARGEGWQGMLGEEWP